MASMPAKLLTAYSAAQSVAQWSLCLRGLTGLGTCGQHLLPLESTSGVGQTLRFCASSSRGGTSEHLTDASDVASSAGASHSDSHAEYEQADEYYDEHDQQLDRGAALRRVLRSCNAAELAAVHFFRGYSSALHGRVDARFFEEQEAQAAESVRQLLPRYRVRPSLAQGPLSLACLALGAAAAAAPPRIGLAVVGAVGEALSEHYNEQLRQVNEAGVAQEAPDVRRTLRSLRDLGRVPEGAPAAPDLMSVVQEGLAAATSGGGGSGGGGGGAAASSVLSGVAGAVQSWGVEGTAGAVVKAGARVALEAAARL